MAWYSSRIQNQHSSKLPDLKIIRVVKGAITTEANCPVNPALGDNPNVSDYRIVHAAVIPGGEVRFVTGDKAKTLSGTTNRVFVTWYDGITLQQVRQVALNGISPAYTTVTGDQGRLLLTGNTPPLLIDLAKPSDLLPIKQGSNPKLVPGGYLTSQGVVAKYRMASCRIDGTEVTSISSKHCSKWQLRSGDGYADRREFTVRYNTDHQTLHMVGSRYQIVDVGESSVAIDIERGIALASCPGRFLGATVEAGSLRIMANRVDHTGLIGYSIATDQ